ncbi:MAG: hypothetical protein WD845_16170 [Pirellulales bacterium]
MRAPNRLESQAAASATLKLPAKITPVEQLRLARQFVARVGGLASARRALAMLMLMNRAA